VLQYEFADQGAWYLIGLGVVAVGFALFLPRGLWSLLTDRLHVHLLPVGYRLERADGPSPGLAEEASIGSATDG
jgi:branched-chain amino acid transport system permease protein